MGNTKLLVHTRLSLRFQLDSSVLADLQPLARLIDLRMVAIAVRDYCVVHSFVGCLRALN
jgi:hypothetical protein